MIDNRDKVYDPLLENGDASSRGGSPSTRHPNFFTKAETRRWLILLTLGSAVVYATRVTMPLCLVAMSGSQKWSKTESGSLLSAFFWGYALTQVSPSYGLLKLAQTQHSSIEIITSPSFSLQNFMDGSKSILNLSLELWNCSRIKVHTNPI